MRAGDYLVHGKQIRNKKQRKRRRERETQTQFVYLVFRQHLCRINLTRLSEPLENNPPPPLETVLFFPGKCLPVGMGVFPYGSKLYLVGGEKLSQCIDFGHRFAPPQHLHGFNLDLYRIDPSIGGDFSPELVRSIPPMTGAKPGAKAVVVDGKVYVFTGGQFCFQEIVPTPRFECYYIDKNLWRTLPDPPFYDQKYPLYYVYLSVLGRHIYLHCGAYYLVFDIDSEQWRDDYECLLVKPFPFQFFGSMAEGDGGISVAYTIKGLVAYRDTTLTRPHRLLPHLSLSRPDPLRETSFIRHLGRNVFCHVLTFVFQDKIRITTFVVRGMQDGAESAGEDLLEASVLGHHVYDLSSVLGKEFYPPRDVFTMCQKA